VTYAKLLCGFLICQSLSFIPRLPHHASSSNDAICEAAEVGPILTIT